MQETRESALSGQNRYQKLDEGQTVRVIFPGYVLGLDKGGIVYYSQHYSQKHGFRECTRTTDEPKDKCELCVADEPRQTRVAMTVYNIDSQQARIWDASIAWLTGREGVEKATFKLKPPSEFGYIMTRVGTGKNTRYPLVVDERITDELKGEIEALTLFTEEDLIGGKGIANSRDNADDPGPDEDVPF